MPIMSSLLNSFLTSTHEVANQIAKMLFRRPYATNSEEPIAWNYASSINDIAHPPPIHGSSGSSPPPYTYPPRSWTPSPPPSYHRSDSEALAPDDTTTCNLGAFKIYATQLNVTSSLIDRIYT